MTEIINLNECILSRKNGMYGGAAGNKDGIVYNGDNNRTEKGAHPMPVIKGLEWTFDTAAKQYEKLRPEYVPKLYEDIFKYKQIDKTSHVLEVGIFI